MGNFKFGDHSTKDFDLVIQAPPTYNFPEKDVSIEHIPGRNGDLVIDNNCWKNTERTYSIASIFRPGTDFVANSERLIKWLTSMKGYHRLEDSYDPNVYRMATYRSSGSLTNYYDQATALNVTFECKPQRYLKNGELSVNFIGTLASLENPTGYPALPLISIDGITPSDNQVLLVTVRNLEENKVTSIVTLNKIITDAQSYDIVIDSDLQTVYSIQNGDVNAYVNLNDKEFPTLYSGVTEVSIDKYSESQGTVSKYESLIDTEIVGTNTCFAKYKPFDSVVESKQKSFYIMSFDLLKQKEQEVYEMKAYGTYCLEKAEDYTFTSFNTLISNLCQSFSFQGDHSAAPEWLDFSEEGKIKVGDLEHLDDYGKTYGYFLTTNANNPTDKKIIKLSRGQYLSEGYKDTATVTINFYPADDNGDFAIKYSEEYTDNVMPDWLSFSIETDTVDGLTGLTKIIFKHKREGFYYLPKSGLFGKAKWQFFNSEAELNSLTWNSSKKAFMPSGISTSTTISYQYYFIPHPYHGVIGDEDYQEYLQYEDVMQNELDENGQVKRDANGNPIQKVISKVHFTVVPVGGTTSDLSLVNLFPSEIGYFRMNDDSQGSGWSYKQDTSTSIAQNIKATSSQIIYFLKNSPTYENVDGFPDWLDPTPIKYDKNHDVTDSINPKYIDFKVKEDAWYRYTYESDGTKNTCWVWRNANSILGKIIPGTDIIYPTDDPGYSGDRTNENSCTIYKLDGVQTEFPVKKYVYVDPDDSTKTVDNIAICYKTSTGEEVDYTNNIPPSWLKISINKGTAEDGSDTMLEFYPQQNGLYKWDQKNVWETKQSSTTEALVTSKITDDTSVYFMSSIPQYPTSGDIYDKCSVEVNVNKSTGNPETITVFAKTAGYFRAKNSSSWKYYEIGDEICNSKISENTDIYYLTSAGSLSGITISIIPRWWSL